MLRPSGQLGLSTSSDPDGCSPRGNGSHPAAYIRTMRLLLPLLLLLAACESSPAEIRQPRIVQPFVPPEQTTAAPPAKAAPRPDPLLIPGDVLKITVFRQQDLDLEVRILDNGTFNYPL